MGALAELLQRHSPAAILAIPANPGRVNQQDSQLSQDSQEGNAYLRARLLELAAAEHIDAALIHRLPDDDVAACEGSTDDLLRGYIAMLAITDLRERGQVPTDETATALCRHCGPVWVHPHVANVSPVVDGWPVVLGCPWCFIRAAGRYVPRPLVACGDCTHFVRDTINPAGGMGRCGAGCDPLQPLPYPHTKRSCATWRPSFASTMRVRE